MDANEINKLYNKKSVQEGLGFFQNATNNIPNRMLLGRLGQGLGYLGGAGAALGGAITAAQPMIDVHRYLKSLGNYATVANQNKNKSGKTDKQIIRDFNDLYFNQAQHNRVGDRVIRNLSGMNGLYSPIPVIGEGENVSQTATFPEPPKATQAEQDAMAVADALTSATPDVNRNTTAEQIPVTPISIPSLQPIQQRNVQSQPVQGQSTGGAAPMTLEDLINIAQSVRQQQAQANADYIAEIEGALQNQQNYNKQAMMRDLLWASMAGLTKNNAYTNMMGRYNPQQVANDRIKLQQLLAQQKQGQVFDPTSILANAFLMKQLGLPEQAAMASKDAMNMYGNVYRTQQGTADLANKLEAQRLIQEAILKDRQDRWAAELEQRKREYENPRFNNLAAQASVVGSIMNQAQFDPRVKNMITPEFIEYAMGLTGYKPTQAQPATQSTPTIIKK